MYYFKTQSEVKKESLDYPFFNKIEVNIKNPKISVKELPNPEN